nr:DegT/DnrJ/EryC1/StrS family aminotransferase [Microbacterium sp. MF43]
MLDLAHQHRAVAGDVEAGFARVLAEQTFVLGPEVEAFERAYARYVGVDHAIGVGNGTDALELALRAVGVGPGDDVVIPANTFVATAEAVVRVGASVRLVDCGDDFLLDTGMLPSVVGSRTRAVIPVHLYGALADVAEIRRIVGPDVAIIEDAAQSQGARRDGLVSGALGDVAATSFYPGKNLGAYGDAGAVTTASPAIARAVRALRNHGGEARYEHLVVGSNSRLDGLQAIVLAAKLAHLDRWNAERRAIADRYRDALAGDDRILLPPAARSEAHVYHQFVVQVDDRDRVHALMTADGIGVGIHYPRPVHLLPAFQQADLGLHGRFPRAERQARRILSLPIYPGLTEAMQARVIESLRSALR